MGAARSGSRSDRRLRGTVPSPPGGADGVGDDEPVQRFAQALCVGDGLVGVGGEQLGVDRDQGLRAFTERLGAAPTHVPRTCVVATEDPALPPAVQEEWASHASHSVRIPSGHSPHLSHTGEVAAVLAEAVARA
ncbi:alpha/beta fold hydrolase [Streptomyces massasporeus]